MLSPEDLVRELGEGWVAEEALAVALYAVLATAPETGGGRPPPGRPREAHFRAAIAVAVNHSGDSDSTASIAGNILGAFYGEVPAGGLAGGARGPGGHPGHGRAVGGRHVCLSGMLLQASQAPSGMSPRRRCRPKMGQPRQNPAKASSEPAPSKTHATGASLGKGDGSTQAGSFTAPRVPARRPHHLQEFPLGQHLDALAAVVQFQDAPGLAGQPAGAQVPGHEAVPHHQDAWSAR